MSQCSQWVAYILCWISTILTVGCIALPDWRKNDVQGEVVETIIRTQGLWWKCTFFPTGNWQCDDYDRFFIALPTAVIGARVFCMLSAAFQLIILISVPIGMDCAHVIENDPRTKHKIIMGSGFLSILAGVMVGVAVSWYAALVVEDYSRYATGLSAGIETTVQRFVYGKALYFGWAAMSAAMIAGVFLCCSSWGGPNQYYEDDVEEVDYSDIDSRKPMLRQEARPVQQIYQPASQTHQVPMVNMNETQPTFISQPAMTQFVPVQVMQQQVPTYAQSMSGSRTRYM